MRAGWSVFYVETDKLPFPIVSVWDFQQTEG